MTKFVLDAGVAMSRIMSRTCLSRPRMLSAQRMTILIDSFTRRRGKTQFRSILRQIVMINVGVSIALLIVSVLAADQCKPKEAYGWVDIQEPALRKELRRAVNNTNTPDYTKYCGMIKPVKECMEKPMKICNKTFKAFVATKFDKESGTDIIDCPGFDRSFNGADTAARSLTFIVITTAIAAFIPQ